MKLLVLEIIVVLVTAVPSASRAASFDHTYRALDKVLHTYVKDGLVAYGTLKRNRKNLDAYTDSLETLSIKTLAGFSQKQAMAFWINAYNALTLRLILDEQPQRSIRDLKHPWKKKRFTIAGKLMSLDDIEHAILRKTYRDGRLHAVLVCAARSCPILESHAFLPDRLEEQLEYAAQRFARDTQRNRYDAKGKELQISRIFEWYGQDLIEQYARTQQKPNKEAAIRSFFEHFLKRDIPADTRISYLDYDWTLNGSW